MLSAALAAGVVLLLAARLASAAPKASIHRLTDTPDVRESFPVFVDGPRVAYLRAGGPRPAQWQDELWLASADGSQARRILGPGCFHLRPSHSRRLWIACSRYVDVESLPNPSGPDGWQARMEVWAMPVGGTRLRQVVEPGSWFLDGWSRDGALHLHEGRLGYDALRGFHEATGFPPLQSHFLFPWMEETLRPLADPRARGVVCDRGPDRAQIEDAGVWSLDGRGCIRVRRFERDGKPRLGYDYVAYGKAPVRILESEEHLTYSSRPWLPAVVWLGGGRVLLQRFYARPDALRPQSTGTFLLVVAHPASGASRAFAPKVHLGASPDPVVSPDGSRVLLRGQAPGGTPELWTVSSSGSDARRILADDADYTPWAWSTDGRSLVVTRIMTGEHDLWRIDVR